MNQNGEAELGLGEIARDAGVTAWIHATRLTGPAESIGLGATVSVSIASLYKLPLALVWADLVEQGELQASSTVRLRAKERISGPTGTAMLLDDVSLSQRDLVRFMLALSDNAAGDAILALIGRDRVHAHLKALGLSATLIRQGSAEATRALIRDTGAPSRTAAEGVLADPDRVSYTSQYDSALASAGSAEELTAVLRILWSRAGESYEMVRDAMAHQAWRHRIGSGFPHDDVTVWGKTGSLGRLRHEVAVVQYPLEHPVAVAVLTRAARPERHLPRVDTAIGELAREAAAPLRLPVS
ncbi:serine hydrolase [Aeromicrobium sp.]|uniref:serine hydrolase n=1 Tax=Aeromicrobium sp. TaxID=1871063 RepID=UPI0030C5560F